MHEPADQEHWKEEAKLSFCSVSPAPSTDTALRPVGKGKMFKGPRPIFTEQSKRVKLELESNKLITGTLYNYLRMFRTLKNSIL